MLPVLGPQMDVRFTGGAPGGLGVTLLRQKMIRDKA